MTVSADQRQPFFWKNADRKQALRVKLHENSLTYGWSGSIDIGQPVDSMISFTLHQQQFLAATQSYQRIEDNSHPSMPSSPPPSPVKYMKLDIREDDELVFLVFHECESEDNAVYVIENKLADVSLTIY